MGFVNPFGVFHFLYYRLGYAIHMVKEILPANMDINEKARIFYDIGCKLKDSLKHSNIENLPLDQLIFIIPVWHCYAHLRPMCQSIMSSRCVPGNGLIDGEIMER